MCYQVVIINGRGGSGKDTFVNLVSELNSSIRGVFYHIHNLSTVLPVKEAVFELTTLAVDPIEKTPEYRRFLSNIKKAWSEYNDGPFVYIKEYIEEDFDEWLDFRGPINILYFVHSREPEEIQRFKDFYGKKGVTLLIKGRDDGNVQINDSDNNVENFNYDYIIDNSGTVEELTLKAKEFLKKIEERLDART